MWRAAIGISLILLVFVPPTFAQDLPAGNDADLDRPWAEGVSPDQQTEARERFQRGNRYFERSHYVEALDHYRSAIELWDHPAVHFNIAVCLINLDQPVEAYGHLVSAMRHGEEGLSDHFHAQAVTYEKLLVGRLARLRIGCAQEGVEVTISGKHLLSCPGETTEHLLPGEHQLLARKPGFVPLARSLHLTAGEETVETLELLPFDSPGTTLVRRWKRSTPWIVLGSGAAAAALGIGVRAQAAADARQFDREVAQLCPEGCAEDTLPRSVRGLRSRARVENAIALTIFAAAGAAVSSGTVMLFMNMPREVPSETSPVPTVSEGAVGLSFRSRF
jgi:hypothetical protein